MTGKMKAAVLYDVDDIRIEQRDIPKIGPGELLVRTRAGGICTGDIMPWYIRRKAPLVLGHEPAGSVVEVGEGVDGFSAGDRVFVHHHAPCFACRFCDAGDYVQCATWRSSKIDPGGLAEYFRVPRENVGDTLRLPEDVSFADGALVEPLACVVKSLRRSGLKKGQRLHIIGLGVMGLMHAVVARKRGIDVSGSDFDPKRRKHAGKLGITVLDEPEKTKDFDAVICGPGSAEALRSAFATVKSGGTVVMFTPLDPGEPFTFDPNDLYFRDIRFTGSYSCGPNDTREALGLLERGVLSAEKLGASYFSLEEAPQAYAALARREILKPIVTFEPSLFG